MKGCGDHAVRGELCQDGGSAVRLVDAGKPVKEAVPADTRTRADATVPTSGMDDTPNKNSARPGESRIMPRKSKDSPPGHIEVAPRRSRSGVPRQRSYVILRAIGRPVGAFRGVGGPRSCGVTADRDLIVAVFDESESINQTAKQRGIVRSAARRIHSKDGRVHPMTPRGRFQINGSSHVCCRSWI